MAENRIYPLARPPGHKPPMERWKLDFPSSTSTSPTTVYTAYIGIQRHSSTPDTLAAFTKATQAIQVWLSGDTNNDPVAEKFTFIEGDDAPSSLTWVCYWSNLAAYSSRMSSLNLPDIYDDIGKPDSIGLWIEKFTTPTSRLETNYSGLDYLPGLARLPGSQTVGHTLTAYWGAARDRIPDSAKDLFGRSAGGDINSNNLNRVNSSSTDPSPTPTPTPKPAGLRQRLSGVNRFDNLVHIRSGQFWGNCDAVETEAYEAHLEPSLRAGLRWVWENRDESGAMGLRFIRNVPLSNTNLKDGVDPAKETCAAGFFRNLEDLERWAKRHPSHLKIFNGAIRHAKTFGDARKFRTWHEVSVLKKGEAEFEYVNCLPETGVIRFLPLEREDL